MKKLVLLLLTLSSTVFGFTLVGTNSALKGFDTDELNIAINTAGCPADINERINAAIDLWNSVPSSRIKLALNSSTTVTAAALVPVDFSYGETAIITCSTDFGTDTGVASAENQMAGVAYAGAPASSDQNRIAKAFMILNTTAAGSQNINNFDAASVEAVIAHEMGHMLGLGHSDNPKALMYYSSSRQHLALDQDDVDGITFLYPRNEFGQDGFFGCGLTEKVAAAIAAGKGISGGGPKLPPTGTSAAIVFSLLLPLLFAALLKQRQSQKTIRI